MRSRHGEVIQFSSYELFFISRINKTRIYRNLFNKREGALFSPPNIHYTGFLFPTLQEHQARILYCWKNTSSQYPCTKLYNIHLISIRQYFCLISILLINKIEFFARKVIVPFVNIRQKLCQTNNSMKEVNVS